jgi:collagenase-like PrtC family protease
MAGYDLLAEEINQTQMDRIELLAPAKDLETGCAAIDCGADAVYVGAARFGAREAAGNSLGDIEKLARHAHKYWAKVYVTINTLLRDEEIQEAAILAHRVHECGADALIIQDFGLLECDLPPIPLFASTQTHNVTPQKIAFLEKVGFRRVILARELSLAEIREIRAQSSLELETFIHGAICVSYSGQCSLSYACGGRSGNRGQCAQPCRLPYSLVDESGRVIVKDRHLLSIRDLNLTDHLHELISAGVTSFKIEGRLKDKSYVMNVVGHYRRELDALLPGLRAGKGSSGTVELDFEPDPHKTFNRGYTTYFLSGGRNRVGSPDTPKMIGEPVGMVVSVAPNSFVLDGSTELHGGDGLSFFDRGQELTGTTVARTQADTIWPDKMAGIRPGLQLYRNHDHQFLTKLRNGVPRRRIGVHIEFRAIPGGFQVSMQDEDGARITQDWPCAAETARKPETARTAIAKQFTKLGGTEFTCSGLEILAGPVPFLAVSLLNEWRRSAVEALRAERERVRPIAETRFAPNDVPYPEDKLNYLSNVLNRKAAAFFQRHGATVLEPAVESGLDMRGRRVMTTKHCIKYQLDACPRDGDATLPETLWLVDSAGRRLRLEFDCAVCRMHVIFEDPPLP